MSDSNASIRLSRLLGFLDADPCNCQLLADAAAIARDADEFDQARDLLDRYEGLAPLPPALLNLKGLVALDARRFEDAARIFEELLASGPTDPSIRFNLAWAKAVLGDYAAASDLLDHSVTTTLPQAAALKIQMLHHLQELTEALALGERLTELFPDHAPLMSALAIAALDAEEAELARTYALRAGDSHEGLSTIGMLVLNDHDVGQANVMFDRALQANAGSPRALLGKGLCLLATGDAKSAAPWLQQAAEIFKSHPGSWIAVGWAYLLAGESEEARKRFDAAISLDGSFAESQGSLAVVDALQGRSEDAKRRSEIALRLDQNCMSAALAKSLLTARAGDLPGAELIKQHALAMPIGPDGRTITDALVAFGQSAGIKRGAGAAKRPRKPRTNS